MLTRTTLIAAVAALAMTGPVMADGMSGPRILTDDALDGVVAGAIAQFQNYNNTITAQDPDQAGAPAVVPLLETGQFGDCGATYVCVRLEDAMLDHNNIFGVGCVGPGGCLAQGIPRISTPD